MKKIRHGLATLPPLLDTKISGYDKDLELIVRGYYLSDLRDKGTFTETAYLLLYKELPTVEQLHMFSVLLAENAKITSETARSVFSAFQGDEHPCDMIASCFAAMAAEMEKPVKQSEDSLRNQAIAAISQYSLLLSGHIAKRAGLVISLEDGICLNFTESFIRRCFGDKDAEDKARYLDIILRGGAEFSLTPSTFAARSVASTRCSFLSALMAALQSWQGYRHGGASEYAFKDLTAIYEQGEEVETYYRKRQRERIAPFGFGHRLYKKFKDPRSVFLETLSEEIYKKYGGRLYNTAKAAIDYFEHNNRKKLYANPDLYMAIIFDSLGFVEKEISALPLLGRIAGICANIIEENGPMRPLFYGKSQYNGLSLRPFTPLEER